MALMLQELKILFPTKQKSISFLGCAVEVLHNKRLKNSYIRVTNPTTITVKTPYKSHRFILDMLTRREQWIQKEIQNRKENPIYKIKLEDEVLLFGEIISIDHPDAMILRKKLQKIPNANKEKVQKSYDAFYKEIAKNYLTQRAEFFAQKMRLSYSELRFRKMKSRWGSCSSQKKITLNTALMKVNKELIDYVVVHELAHLVHMNHSKAFHALVEEYLPNSKAKRTALKSISLQE